MRPLRSDRPCRAYGGATSGAKNHAERRAYLPHESNDGRSGTLKHWWKHAKNAKRCSPHNPPSRCLRWAISPTSTSLASRGFAISMHGCARHEITPSREARQENHSESERFFLNPHRCPVCRAAWRGARFRVIDCLRRERYKAEGILAVT